MKHCLIFSLFLALALGCGCERQAVPAAVSSAPLDPGEPTSAQPQLQTMKLYVGANEIISELALTAQQQRTGMMFRTNMAENAGMLFPLPVTQRANFWMKNCPYPLSAAYIDEEGVIREIHDFKPFDTNGVVSAEENIRFVLETRQGWFERHQVKPGVVVAPEGRSLMQTFFKR
jgi:uncharacterized membrane protein (UPF0127 family)